MTKKFARLPEAELQLMMCLWDANSSVTRLYLSQKLRTEKGWADSTILSMLTRLEKKGFICVAKDKNKNIYTAKIQKEQYLSVENNNFLSTLYNNSFKSFVATMAGTNKLTDSDIKELEDYLAQLKEK